MPRSSVTLVFMKRFDLLQGSMCSTMSPMVHETGRLAEVDLALVLDVADELDHVEGVDAQVLTMTASSVMASGSRSWFSTSTSRTMSIVAMMVPFAVSNKQARLL